MHVLLIDVDSPSAPYDEPTSQCVHVARFVVLYGQCVPDGFRSTLDLREALVETQDLVLSLDLHALSCKMLQSELPELLVKL